MAGAALVLVASLLAGAGAARAYSAAGPQYTVGDSWTYMETATPTPPPGFGPTTSFNFDLGGTRTERVTAVNGGVATMAEVAKLKLTYNFSYQGTTSSSTVYINGTFTATPSARDGTFYVNTTSQTGGSYASTSSLRGTLHMTRTVLQDSLTYPLESGHKYTTVARIEVTVDLGAFTQPLTLGVTAHTDYLAGPSEDVTVPAGTFLTLPLASWTNASDFSIGGQPVTTGPTHGNLTQLYYAPAVGNYVKTIGYDGAGRQVFREELSSYSYGANAPNRILQFFTEPGFWWGLVAAIAVVGFVGAYILGKRRAPVPPPPPPTGETPPGVSGEPGQQPPPVEPSEGHPPGEEPPPG